MHELFVRSTPTFSFVLLFSPNIKYLVCEFAFLCALCGAVGIVLLTQNRHNHIVLHHLHGAVVDVVDVVQRVAFPNQILPGSAEVGFYVQREQFQAALNHDK